MGKLTGIIIGAGLVCLGSVGTYNAITSFGRAPKEKTDITTTGVVTDRTATELRHAVGVTLDTTYRIEFSFEAEDGKTYFGEEIVEAAVIDGISEGQEITVKYHSNNPSINAAPDYGYYVSVNDIPSAPPLLRLCVCLGTLAGGLVVVVLSLRTEDGDQQKRKGSAAQGRKQTKDDLRPTRVG